MTYKFAKFIGDLFSNFLRHLSENPKIIPTATNLSTREISYFFFKFAPPEPETLDCAVGVVRAMSC